MSFQDVLARRLGEASFGADTAPAASAPSFFREYQTEILVAGSIGIVALMFAVQPSAPKRR